MRKKSFLSFIIMLLFATTSCSSDEPAITEPGGSLSGDAGKTLIVYFSWSGNTQTVANHIHDLIGGDIVEVETVIPYPDSYEEVIQVDADRTGRAGERLLSRVENKGGEYGRVRHADCRNPHLGRASYPGHEELSGKL